MVARFFDCYRLCHENVVRRVRSLSAHPGVQEFFDRHPALKPAVLGFAWLSVALFFALIASEFDQKRAEAFALSKVSADPGIVRQILSRFQFQIRSSPQTPSEIRESDQLFWIHESYEHIWINQTPLSRIASSSLPQEGWKPISLNWIEFQHVIENLLKLEQASKPIGPSKRVETDPRAIVY